MIPDTNITIEDSASSWTLAWRFARREMRGSLRRFRVFLGALLLGVAAIGTVGSVADAMRNGIANNARVLLGGDIELSSRHTPPDTEIISMAQDYGTVSQVVQMRAMLQATDQRKLVELKAVDDMWPLVGNVDIEGAPSLSAALADKGVVADPSLLRSLNLEIGDEARLGDTTVRIAANLVTEPDRSISFVSFGPRVLISNDTLAETGLQQPGSFISYKTRLILDNPVDNDAVTSALLARAQSTHVRVRNLLDAAPGFDTFINQAEIFLVLVGLTALLIGGLGVAGAVRAWLTSRMPVIATLKCLGAPSKLIFRIYLLQVMSIAMVGVIAGVTVGAVAPLFAIDILSSYVTVPLDITLYPRPLLIAAGFGIGTSFLFALWPLAKAEEVRAAHLFRSLNDMPGGLPKPLYVGISLIAVIALSVLAFLATGNLLMTVSFIGGSILSLFLLAGLGDAMVFVLRRIPAPQIVPIRLALSAITRPGSPVRSMVIAFGLGLSVLVAVSVSEANLNRQIDARVAEDAPAWFFIDIQPHQIDAFETIASNITGISNITKTPMLRGRVSALNGVLSSEIDAPPGAEWVLRGDRALTWSATPPKGSNIVEGTWWPDDYKGPPLVSMAKEEADEFGLVLGDTISVNVLGRNVTAKIVNFRDIEWQSFNINFLFVLSPGVLDKAPHSWIATTDAVDDDATDAVERAVTNQFSNVSAVSVKEAVRVAQRVIGLLGGAVQITALVTLVAGIAVLAGTVASTEAQRLSDSVILKVLGATRLSISIAWFLEYAFLGILAGIAAAIIGSLASYGLVAQILNIEFELDIMLVLITTLAGAGATALLGLAGAVKTLGHKPGPLLREV
ncbi:ABC transporter permease [Candidatus Puniceispirillum sp.]|uniref:ABC transporter permease n=1 Tax=Candidatus Puniceispirillum sp. TaxID=2026719 RepID=UPI003F695BC1